jgi:hypothetical protein
MEIWGHNHDRKPQEGFADFETMHFPKRFENWLTGWTL